MPGETPDVVLSTHSIRCRPYFGCTEDDEFLYGRGTCDAKGILAAQVAAAERLRDAGVKVGMLFVVGEERDSAGAKVANENPRGSRFLINGEPTDNRLASRRKARCAWSCAPRGAWRTRRIRSWANRRSTNWWRRCTTCWPCRCRSSRRSGRDAECRTDLWRPRAECDRGQGRGAYLIRTVGPARRLKNGSSV